LQFYVFSLKKAIQLLQFSMEDSLNSTRVLDFVKERWNEPRGIVEQLCEYISIPNQSPDYDPEWATNGHMDKAIELMLSWVKAQEVPGLKLEIIREEGRTPLILLEIAATNGDKKETVLMYGHMDKQPPLTEGWEEGLGPYKPVIRDGKLYGRGGADDGYAIFSAITAIKAVKAQGVPHSRIVVVVEACEESGSADLPYYIKKNMDKLGDVRFIICLDSGCGNYEQLWLTTSLRGIAAGVLKVTVLREGLHSGAGSGVVPSSFRIVRHLLDRIEDSATGRILLPECWVEIPQPRIEQAKQTAEVLGTAVLKTLPLAGSTRLVHDDLAELLLNRTWRPQLSVTGADGFPSAKVAGNVLRPYSAFKLSLRLPPTADPHNAITAVKTTLEKDPPHGAQVEFSAEEPDAGWSSPILANWLQASVDLASHTYYHKPPLQYGEGGSIPFMGMLGRLFPEAQFVVTGILGPSSNAHGPNEFLHIDMAIKLTCCITQLLVDFNKHISK